MSAGITRKRNARASARPRQIVSALRTLGVPERLLSRPRGHRKASIWLRPINHLQVLEHARKAYRAQIVGAHPDKQGDAEQAIRLNRAWRHVQRKFRENGYELG